MGFVLTGELGCMTSSDAPKGNFWAEAENPGCTWPENENWGKKHPHFIIYLFIFFVSHFY